ncbi:DinB family protein [Streptomyces boninensis]|uniref:DinB family protein n=1 Tax=Streptomyces boninensis TaxID=2039455 RepID=UPI003B22269F
MTRLPDGRLIPHPRAGERDALEEWLDFQRDTLALKCAGLTDEQARRPSAEPSTLTLLGLVQHLAEVERNWFRRIFAGEELPPVYGEDNASGYVLSPDRTLDDALATLRAEIAAARAAVADASLDDTGHHLNEMERGYVGDDGVALRWILLHMIEEYARHNGHADLIRERIDGAVGT